MCMQTNGSWYRAGGLRTRRRYHDAREERSSEGGDVEIAAGRRSVNPCVRQDVFTSAGGFRARLHLWRKCGREVTSFPEGLCRASEWPSDRTYTTQSGEGSGASSFVHVHAQPPLHEGSPMAEYV